MKKLLFIFTIALITNTIHAQSKADEQKIKETVNLLQDGWNTANGETFAKAFTETHDFIVWNGYYFKGQTIEQNAMGHNRIFSTMYKDTQLFYEVDKIKFLSSDIALVHVLGAVTSKKDKRPENPQVLISMVLQKNNDTWKIVSFHNLDLEVLTNEEMKKGSPIPTNVMFSNWYANASN